jgi:hypothetical protein
MIQKMKDLTINLALGKIFNKYENSPRAEVVAEAGDLQRPITEIHANPQFSPIHLS